MKKEKMKYSKIEILEFLRSSHRQIVQVEIGLPNEDEITNDLTIRNWIDDMELLNWKELCKYYCRVFEIERYEIEFRESMLPMDKKTIGEFCEFVAKRAVKPELEAVKLFGRHCEEAGIFKYLKRKLADENESKSNEIKPSSKIENYMSDFAFKIVEEVNKINSTTLPTIKYEPNEFEKRAWQLTLAGTIGLLAASVIDSWLVAGIGIGLVVVGICMHKVSLKVKPSIFEFEGIETFRDLVELIKKENHVIQQKT